MTNKRLTLVLEISFICLVTVRPLFPSVATLYHVNDQLQRAYYSLNLSPSSRSPQQVFNKLCLVLTSSPGTSRFPICRGHIGKRQDPGDEVVPRPKSYCRAEKN